MDEEREKAVKCLRQLRNLLTDDTDLKLPIHDEKFLIRFVRAKKYDAELAHTTVRKYYTTKQKNPKIYKTLYPSLEPVKQALDDRVVGKLKQNDSNGCPIILFRQDVWDVEKENLDQLTAAIILVLEDLLIFSLEAQLNGVVFMADFQGLTLSRVKEFTLGRIRHFVNIWQGNYPLKLKGFYIVNEPTIFDIILIPALHFMSEKMKNRFKVFGDDKEKMHAVLPPSMLSENYGGTLKESEFYDEDFKENLLKRDPYYKEMLEYGFGNWDSDDEDTYM